ncbi:MAG: RNA polymerase sigma factor [Terriglobales bacterium]
MDSETFEQAVAAHQRMVFSLALHTLRDRALAEELTQDVFLALLENRGRIESAEHLVQWLRRVTARRCIDQLRRLRWRRWLSLRESDEAAGVSASALRGDPLLAGRLQRLLRGLPAAVRVALVLRYQEDLEPAEIGRVLGIPENDVRKKLRHALVVLKLRLQPPQPPGPPGPQKTAANHTPTPPGNLHACVPAALAPTNLEQG